MLCARPTNVSFHSSLGREGLVHGLRDVLLEELGCGPRGREWARASLLSQGQVGACGVIGTFSPEVPVQDRRNTCM